MLEESTNIGKEGEFSDAEMIENCLGDIKKEMEFYKESLDKVGAGHISEEEMERKIGKVAFGFAKTVVDERQKYDDSEESQKLRRTKIREITDPIEREIINGIKNDTIDESLEKINMIMQKALEND